MREAVTTVLELAGLALIAAGFGLIWLPFGLIAAGCVLVLVGYKAAR